DVPEALDALLQHMLAKKPEQRPSTPAEVAAALEPFARGSYPSPPPRSGEEEQEGFGLPSPLRGGGRGSISASSDDFATMTADEGVVGRTALRDRTRTAVNEEAPAKARKRAREV